MKDFGLGVGRTTEILMSVFTSIYANKEYTEPMKDQMVIDKIAELVENKEITTKEAIVIAFLCGSE